MHPHDPAILRTASESTGTCLPPQHLSALCSPEQLPQGQERQERALVRTSERTPPNIQHSTTNVRHRRFLRLSPHGIRIRLSVSPHLRLSASRVNRNSIHIRHCPPVIKRTHSISLYLTGYSTIHPLMIARHGDTRTRRPEAALSGGTESDSDRVQKDLGSTSHN